MHANARLRSLLSVHGPVFVPTALVLGVAASFAAPDTRAAAAIGSPVTGEIPVNTFTAGSQTPAGVAMDAVGDFVVTWSSAGQDGSGLGTYARVFGVDGTPRTGEIPVNVATLGDQRPVGVAMDAAGDFVVAWTSQAPDATGPQAFARTFTLAGAPRSGEVAVDLAFRTQTAIGVAMDPAGDFVVAWVDDYIYGNCFARVFSLDGTPSTNRVQVNTFPAEAIPSTAGVAMDAQGDFVVLWDRYSLPDDSLHVPYLRLFSKDGVAKTRDIEASLTDGGTRIPRAIAMDPLGDIVVAWNHLLADDNTIDNVARRFKPTGAGVSAEIPLNAFGHGDQVPAGIAMDAQGRFVAAWTSQPQDGSGPGTYARVFSAKSAAMSNEVPVNVRTLGQQIAAGTAMNAQGDFVVVWGSNGQDGNFDGVFARRFAGPEGVDTALVQTDSPDPVASGGTITYTLTATNHHPAIAPSGVPAIDSAIGVATGVAIVNALPPGTTFQDSIGDGWACLLDTGQFVCDFTGSLAPGAFTQVQVQVAAGAGVSTITSNPTLVGDQVDPLFTNNTDPETTKVACDAGTLSLFRDARSVQESIGTLSVTVERTGGTCGAATVNFATANGTAKAVSDYIAVSGTLRWADGEGGQKGIPVKIVNDAVKEGRQGFTVNLSAPVGGALGTRTELIRILDDD